MKLYIFYQILLIDNKTFLDSPFGSEKVVIGIAAIESSVLVPGACCNGLLHTALLGILGHRPVV